MRHQMILRHQMVLCSKWLCGTKCTPERHGFGCGASLCGRLMGALDEPNILLVPDRREAPPPHRVTSCTCDSAVGTLCRRILVLRAASSCLDGVGPNL